MIVCSCNVLSDTQIRTTIADQAANPRTPGQVYRCLGCSAQCGRCARTIKAMLDDIKGLKAPADSACGACPAVCPAAHGTAAIDFLGDVADLPALEHAHG